MKRNIEYIVYVVGIVLLGLFYAPLKSVLGGGVWFVLGVFALLLLLRGVGILSRRIAEHRRENLTEKLNEVYSDNESISEFDPNLAATQTQSLKRDEF